MSVVGSASSHLDGRGGIEPILEERKSYIYYRIYAKDNALESINPIYSNDRSISRILFKSITPPRNVASLKRHLWKVEGFDGSPACTLYLSSSVNTPAEDLARLPPRGQGSGSSELDPIALVVDTSEVEKRLVAARKADLKTFPDWPHKQPYVYYRIYDQDGEIASKTSFDQTDTSLGRINILFFPPPHHGASLKARLSQVEEITACDVKIFKDDSGEDTLMDNDIVDLLSDTYPGVTADEPMAIVCSPQKPIPASDPMPPGFSKLLRATLDSTMGAHDPTWHSAKEGEIFHTDGKVTPKRYYMDAWVYPCYVAINSSGKQAFIKNEFAALCGQT